MKRLFIKLMLLLTVAGVNPVLAVITSGWETESALVKLKTGSSWPPYYAYPSLADNLRGDGKFVLISGQEAYGGYFGYYWDTAQQQWVSDSSIVAGLSAHGWNEAPALAYNVLGDNKWTLIGYAGGSFYGYYWDGAKWVADVSRVAGLSGVSGEISHVLLNNLKGDGVWTLISGNYDQQLKAFFWDGAKWAEDSSRVLGITIAGDQIKITAGFNVYGDQKWNLLAAGKNNQFFNNFFWDGAKWVEDPSKIGGLDVKGFAELSPAFGFNLRGDNKWVLLAGLSQQRKLIAFFYNTADTENLPTIQNITDDIPLATTFSLSFSYLQSWDYRIFYSTNPDLSSGVWSAFVTDKSGAVSCKILNLLPEANYFYQIYAYLPWDRSFYTLSAARSFKTIAGQSYLQVLPGESIQSAIETLSLSGGTVELVKGTHILNGQTIRVIPDNVTIKGQGINATILEGGGIYISKWDNGGEREAYWYSYKLDPLVWRQKAIENPQDFVINCVIRDLTIHNPGREGIYSEQGWGLNIDNVKIYHDSIVNYLGIKLSDSRLCIVQNCNIRNFARSIFYWGCEQTDTVGNTLSNGFEGIEYNGGYAIDDALKVQNNHISEMDGSGIYLYSVPKLAANPSPYSIIASGNIIEKAGKWKDIHAGISSVLSYKILMENNIIKSSQNGITIATKNNWTVKRYNVGQHLLRNNILSNNYTGILFYDSEPSPYPLGQQNFVYSNTIYGNTNDGVDNSQGHNISLRNNIIVKNARYGIKGVNSLSSYNDVFDNSTANYNGMGAGIGDVAVDPLFADSWTGDFHLRSQYGRWSSAGWVNDEVTSPCINAGDPADDYAQEPQPNGGRINIGMYGNSVEASKSSIVPPPPPLEDLPKVNNIKVYPNPYIKGKSPTEKITFANLPMEATIRIYTPDGKLVAEIEHRAAADGGLEEWDVSNVSSGIYLYVITSSEGVKKGKVSVIK